MKKILILICAVILTVITYNFYENKNVEESKTTEEISYRTEEYNLIKEEDMEVEAPASDQEITTYLSEVNNEVSTIISKEEITKEDEYTLKNTFITLTDFIFYNGTIKGKTFNDLTASAKESVISLYEKIDEKIESKFPGYKETIKDRSEKTYNNIKDKVISLKDGLLEKYKQEIGEDNYAEQGEIIDESINTMKDSFSPVIDTIVEKSKDVYEKAKDKASTWYEEFKEDNAQ